MRIVDKEGCKRGVDKMIDTLAVKKGGALGLVKKELPQGDLKRLVGPKEVVPAVEQQQKLSAASSVPLASAE